MIEILLLYYIIYYILTNIVGFLGDQSPLQSDHLNGVQAYLDDIINQGQKRSERKRCHKYGGEAELDHWGESKVNNII